MTEARNKFREEWEWFCGRVNFGQSAMDARAISFMNEFNQYVDAVEKEAGDKK